jgi:hypothetical protein
MIQTDRYLICKPRSISKGMSADLLRYAETVRRASEWIALGFAVQLDEYGLPMHSPKSTYTFFIARENDPFIAAAIRTGKKAIKHHSHVFDYFLIGCDLSEFVDLPEDVRCFCRGNLLRIKGRLVDGLPFLERAVELNPSEVRYREIYYPLRLALGDLSVIEDELAYFERDIDSVIHSGRFDEWIRVLIANGEYQYANAILARVGNAISKLANGTATAQYYGQQKADWYVYKKEQFAKKADKLLRRINKLEAKSIAMAVSSVRASRKAVKNTEPIKALRGTKVAELLYNFAQRCFVGEALTLPLDLSAEGYVFERLASGPLSLLEVHQLPPMYRRVVREILTQYIMFLEMNRELPFPPDFLDDSSIDRLGSMLLLYIHEHRWPFPQSLPRQLQE